MTAVVRFGNMQKMTQCGFLVLLIGALAGCRTADQPSSSRYEQLSPAHGTIRTKTGSREEKIWFTSKSTRHDMKEGDNSLMTQATGDTRWIAYPAAQRVWTDPPSSDFRAYPAEIRRRFQHTFADRAPNEKEEVLGLPCRRYSWHEAATQSGCIHSAARDVTYWVLDNPSFPLVMRFQSGSNVVREIVSVDFCTPVKGRVFAEPENLTPTTHFHLPDTNISVRFQVRHENREYGWTTTNIWMLVRSGDSITETWEKTYHQNDGRNASRTQKHRTLSAEQLRGTLHSKLRPPSWSTVKKEGEDRFDGLDADVCVNVMKGFPDETHWIVDHPTFGTITVKRIKRYSGGTETFEVMELELPNAESTK